jgi:RNA polymerase sigma factor (sigma-70 family)
VERTSSVGWLAQLQLRRGLPVRAQAVRGDARALAAIYERHHQALYRYCRSILRDDEEAQDALQSTMAKALVALRDEQRDFEVRPWLFRIAHNEAISLLRRRREIADPAAVAAASTDSLTQDVEDRERLAHLRADLQHLPERQRAALVLRELSGLSHKEIASVLDTTPRVVKQTIFEARVALRDCAEGRAMRCEDVQRALSDGDGRVPRGRRMRAHMRSCRSCRQFQAALQSRPAELAALAPALPAAAGAALLGHLLPGAKAGFASGAGAASGAGGGLAATMGTKAAVVVATTAALAGSTAAVRTVVAPPGDTAPSPTHSVPAPAQHSHARQVSSPIHGAPPVLARPSAPTRAHGVARGHEKSNGGSAKHSAHAHGKARASANHAAHGNGKAKGQMQGIPPGQAKKVATGAGPGQSAVAHAQLKPVKVVRAAKPAKLAKAKPAKPMKTTKALRPHPAHPVHKSASAPPAGAAHGLAVGKQK